MAMAKMDKQKLFKAYLPIGVAVLGVLIAMIYVKNPSQAKRRPQPPAQGVLVETAKVQQNNFTIQIEAMGQVVAAQQIELKPRVSGEIIQTSPEFVPGGHFKQGEIILGIDPKDYILLAQKQEAILKQAQANYQLEMGRQEVARSELDILVRSTGSKLDNPSLALRQPQLDQAKAELKKAETDYDVAQLNLDRTVLAAPFNAFVVQRQATAGDIVSPSSTLASLVSTDEFWVRLSVPVADLKWLHIPKVSGQETSSATLVLDGGRGQRQGRLLKMIGSLDPKSRLADLLVSVPDPLALELDGHASPLILGDYVKVLLEGRSLNDTVRLPTSWVRDGYTVWVAEDDVLSIRKITPLYEDQSYIYVSDGVESSDLVITSDVPVPIDGMKIRLISEEEG